MSNKDDELLSASKPAALEGWKMVPVEPTPEMILKGGIITLGMPLNERSVKCIYAAMLSVSPDAAEPAQSGEREASAYETLLQALGYPWLPCPICKGTEGCDHPYPERARAALSAPQPSQPVEDGETSSDAARIERLRKGLFEARDAMRVMSNWVKKSDPAGHSWAAQMVDRANDILSHAPTAAVVLDDKRAAWNTAYEKGYADGWSKGPYARAASPQATVYSLFSSSDRRNFGHLSPQEFVNAVIEAVRAQATATQPCIAPGCYQWDGTDSCTCQKATATQPAQTDDRSAILEEAAKVCDAREDWYLEDDCRGQACAAAGCAKDIRALLTAAQPASGADHE
jgi:hypothetical protein